MCALIRQTWFEAATRNLSDPERLQFYEVCFRYEFFGEEPTRKSCPYSSVLLMFDMVKVDLANDAEKARRIAERNRANGAMGGRPRQSDKVLQSTENPNEPNETHQNPTILEKTTLHNTTQLNTTLQKAAGDLEILDGDFFENVVWPVMDPDGRYRTRHRKCLAMWLTFPELKRKRLHKAVTGAEYVAGSNPYFYMEDFPDPSPNWLTGADAEKEWKAGRSVYQVNDAGKYKLVTEEDLKLFGLTPTNELKPRE